MISAPGAAALLIHPPAKASFTMFRAIGKYFRALGYLVTGRIDKARKTLSTNPHVVQATYDRVVREKKARIQQYKDAVAKMIAQQEKKAHKLKTLTDDVNKLSRLKEGAAAKARILVKKLQAEGQDMDCLLYTSPSPRDS